MLATNQTQAALARITARKLQIIEVDAWFEFLKDLAKNRGLYLELENRYWKSAYVYSHASHEKLGLRKSPFSNYELRIRSWFRAKKFATKSPNKCHNF